MAKESGAVCDEALRDKIASLATSDRAEHVRAARLVTGVAERMRARPVEGIGSAAWAEFCRRFVTWSDNGAGVRDGAVMANMIALATFRDAQDYEDLEELSAAYGASFLAYVQHDVSLQVEPDRSLPLGTAFVHGIAPAVYEDVLAAAFTAERAAALAELCARSALLFMLAGTAGIRPGPDITSPEEFLHHFQHGSLVEWRSQVIRYATDPWSPYANHLVDLADRAGLPSFGLAIRRFIDVVRSHVATAERRAIANEIRDLVERSGVTQREFALRAGTSASRLSTYMTGHVVPSAALMSRLRKTSQRLMSERGQ